MALQKKRTEVGTKARQRDDKEDRTIVYRDFRREAVSKGQKKTTCYTCDVDQIEFIIHKNNPIPVAIIELTRYDFDEYDMASESWAKYRAAVLERYFFRDYQGRFVKGLAEKLGIPAYLVLFRYDVESFWIFDMQDQKALWIHMDATKYKDWLVGLKTSATERLLNDH